MLPSNAVRHLFRYWDRSRALFTSGDFPLTAFCALTLIEEVGKVSILSFRELVKMLGGNTGSTRDHKAKFKSAIWRAVVKIPEWETIYGKIENRVALEVLLDHLDKIRESTLYMERSHKKIVTPEQEITRDKSFLLVGLAGEVLISIQGWMIGTGPEESKRLRGELTEFRERFGRSSTE